MMPIRRPNSELRTREFLTPDEVEQMLKAARKNRHGHRDYTMLLIAYRHGLRASELVDLQWAPPCCVTRAAISWPMTGTTPARCRTG
jgi:integrase